MEERDRIQIEKYFAHELSALEKDAMELRLTTDTEFALEFEAYRQAVEALKLAQREELKERFRSRDRVLDNQSKGGAKNFRYIWLLAAALIVMVLGVWVLNNSREPVLESKIAFPQDTLKSQEVPQLSQDTAYQPENIPMASGEEKDKQKWITDKIDGEELFAANFEPYAGEDLENITRGNEDNLSAYERFQQHYINKEYEKSLEAYTAMSASMQENDNLLFLKANALMALKKIPEAIFILERVSRSNKTGYQVEAMYYLALAELQRENIDKAKVLLEQYVKDTRALEKNAAADILKKLNTK